MSASMKPLSIDEFLAWERAQPHRYEFDGIQPIGPMGMTGGSPMHARLIARVITAASNRVTAPCEVFASELKVIIDAKVRYPDVTIACTPQAEDGDEVVPTIIFEVLSPSTSLTDRRVKPLEYRGVASIQAYVILSQDKPEVSVLRRSAGWLEERLSGIEATLSLPEVEIEIPLAELYR